MMPQNNNPVAQAMSQAPRAPQAAPMTPQAPVSNLATMAPQRPAPIQNVQPQYQPMQTQMAQQRVLTPEEQRQRDVMHHQQQMGAGMASAAMAGTGAGAGGQQPQPSPQQWQQFMQYMQQMQQQQGQYPQQQANYPQQGGYQGYGQQRMQQYGYGQPQGQRQFVQPGAAQGASAAERTYVQPGAAVGASAAERPAQLSMRAQPTMNPVQAAMSVQAPQVQPATSAAPLVQSRPIAAMPQLANNPVQQAMGGGPALAVSDETKKVLSQRSLADDFLDHMKAYTYKYKSPELEPRVSPTGGTYLGVMAQDLEKIPHLGSQLIVETPHGKMVDQKTALSATMAGVARLNERLRAVELDALKKGKK